MLARSNALEASERSMAVSMMLQDYQFMKEKNSISLSEAENRRRRGFTHSLGTISDLSAGQVTEPTALALPISTALTRF